MRQTESLALFCMMFQELVKPLAGVVDAQLDGLHRAAQFPGNVRLRAILEGVRFQGRAQLGRECLQRGLQRAQPLGALQ